MRGAPLSVFCRPRARRIIPADAGSTVTASLIQLILLGSSPRMRGALPVQINVADCARIIPADAGSTQRHAPFSRNYWDHPRGCGEHKGNVRQSLENMGSSPRMRGALGQSYLISLLRRIIPADAGSTRTVDMLHPISKDHPRGCGEHNCQTGLPQCPRGSSPRMRGALAIGLAG